MTTAIANLLNALEIFKAKQPAASQSANHYGIGLTYFTIGYAYMRFSRELCKTSEYGELCEPSHLSLLVDTEQKGRDEARKQFKLAYKSFEAVGHLLGMYRCKNHELALLPAGHSSESVLRQLEESERLVDDYERTEGFKNSCFIPRDRGHDISLMSEIVFQHHKP